MQVHVFDVECQEGDTFRRLLMSDLHYGHPNADKRRIRADLDAARKMGARVLINGDVFDGIQKRDKRYSPSQLDKAVQGRDDLGKALVEMVGKELAPYADIIDVIGIGNHEEAWTRQTSTCLVGLLLDRLNAELAVQGTEHRIRHGGIQGYIRTKFRLQYGGKHSGTVCHDLLYQHGAGGDAPVTKGAIDANRRLVCFDYDCLTFGHKHNKTEGEDAFLYLSPTGKLRQRERIYIQTGSYLWNYKRTTQDDPLRYSYAESGHHSPKPLGAKFLVLRPVRTNRDGPKRGDGRAARWSELRVEQGGIRPELI
jgi:hypothetical protein